MEEQAKLQNDNNNFKMQVEALQERADEAASLEAEVQPHPLSVLCPSAPVLIRSCPQQVCMNELHRKQEWCEGWMLLSAFLPRL